jgi:Methyltransferase domain
MMSERSGNASYSQAWLAEKLSGIEGWTYVEEAWELYQVVSGLPGTEPVTVVEIGAWKGRSTVALALGVRARGSGRVFSIDPHTGNRESIEMFGAMDTFNDFLHNLEQAGVADLVEAIRNTSHDARGRFAEGSVDMLFVDGSHEYLDVLTDIRDWTPALKYRGIIVFNDPLTSGVNRALRETVLTFGSPYHSPRYVGNSLFFEFDTRRKWGFADLISVIWLRGIVGLRYRAQGPAARLPLWMIRLGRHIIERLLPG